MYPILYESITPGVVPTHYGLGTLTDCLSCTVQEARNGVYELELVYPASGIHLNDIQPRRVIKAKPNFTDDPQLFRIYKIGKVMQGKVTCYARHISYDLSGYVIESGSAGSCTAACSVLTNAATGFTITTDKTVGAAWSVKYPSSVRSWLGGKEGSLLDVYGTGEYKYDNFNVSLLLHRGTNRGVTIRYGKNLTELTQELNSENLVTGVIAYYKDSEGNITKAPKVSTGLVLDCTKDYALDCSSDFDETPTVQQLTDRANSYIQNHILTHIISNIKLNFAQISQLKDRVDLCDTVSIYLESLGISATAQCIQTKWDVLAEKYIQTQFGEPKTTITDTIISIGNTAEEAITPNMLTEAINNATSRITGNQGGYVVFHDTDADGKPDEILVLDNLDIDQAVHVWRWNVAGLGYSSTGYNGTYVIALTNDGQIVADLITTGTLNANLIKAGVIEDVGHNSSIDMTSGVATLKDLIAKNKFTHVDANGNIRTLITYNVSDGTSLIFRDTGGTDIVQLFASPTTGGNLILRNIAGNTVAYLESDGVTQGGELGLRNSNQKLVVLTAANSTGEGYLNVYNANGDFAAYIEADPTTQNGEMGIYNSSGQLVASLLTNNTDGGLINIRNASGVQGVSLSSVTAGGYIGLKNPNDTWIAELFAGATDQDGIFNLRDSSGNQQIWMKGEDGTINCKKVKSSEGTQEIYSGVLSSGSTTFNYGDYNLYVVVAHAHSNGSLITMTVPKSILTTSDETFCISDETEYICFKMKYSGTTATLTIGTKSSDGWVSNVYGVY